MPVYHHQSDSLEMDSDMSPSCRRSDLSRGGSLESRSSSSRSRSFTLDDESLKYLTHEEKDVILFFEETLGSLEDDLDEPVCDSGIHCQSPTSLEDSPSSHSEPEDVIDLVQPGPAAGDVGCLPDPSQIAGAAPVEEDDADLQGTRQTAETRPPGAPARPATAPLPPPAEHPRLPRSVPTPLLMAQKISEERAGNGALPRAARAEDGPRTTPASPGPRGGAHGPARTPAARPPPKAPRFPSNISVSNSSARAFGKTISEAAVSVQERKARVLANINGVSFLGGGAQDQAPGRDPSEPGAGSPERPADARGGLGPPASAPPEAPPEVPPARANGFRSVHEALRSERSRFAPTGKSVTFRPDPALAGRGPWAPPQPPRRDRDQDQAAGGLAGRRARGVTVQFSGRGSTEAARREALRKLGLLRESVG
ncbi:PREDICTED: proline and serine-rich protein 2 [Chinchilla lanigera]|uniref:proline and serine-rich protein 2 n=1 Tax=Chinchilla lanigera TaxID=34839 RepID=UPI0006978975|nr:PREDICTED: proline and serine-rich protein 2 [Chinchilla lanigera]